jgi:hypothetical protein
MRQWCFRRKVPKGLVQMQHMVRSLSATQSAESTRCSTKMSSAIVVEIASEAAGLLVKRCVVPGGKEKWRLPWGELAPEQCGDDGKRLELSRPRLFDVSSRAQKESVAR